MVWVKSMNNLLLIFLISVVLAAALSPVVIYLANKLKIVDVPDAKRKFHIGTTPLIGGLAIFLATIISFFINQNLFDWQLTTTEWRLIIALFVASAVLLLAGIADDKYVLKPWQQIIFTSLAIIIMLMAGLKIEFITNPLGGILYFPAGWLSIILVVMWLLGMTYTTKLLDGVDGLATGISLIGGLYLFFVSLAWDRPQSITPQLIILFVGACLGFLLWNFSPAKIFLGESGSTILGFWLGVLAIISGAKIATALVVMAVPVVDVVLVIIQRLLKKQSPFSHGDRKHLHFRLLDAGLSPKQVVVILYLIAIIAGSLALILGTVGKLILFLVLAVATVAMVIYLIKRYDQA